MTHTISCKECGADLEYYLEPRQRGGFETEPLDASATPEFTPGDKCPECGAPAPDSDTVLKDAAEDAADRWADAHEEDDA